jgi:broad specificity phosphatase PhoE
MLTIHLIRHAESHHNLHAPDIVCGRSPHVPLSPRGELQARSLRRYFEKLPAFHARFTSPTVRTRQTMRYATDDLANFQNAPTLLDDRLHELDQGDWVGQSRKILYTPAILKQIHADRLHFTAPNGESVFSCAGRMFHWLEEQRTAFRANPRPTHIAAFSHCVAIKSLLWKILNFNIAEHYPMPLDNASVTLLTTTGEAWQVPHQNRNAQSLSA